MPRLGIRCRQLGQLSTDALLESRYMRECFALWLLAAAFAFDWRSSQLARSIVDHPKLDEISLLVHFNF